MILDFLTWHHRLFESIKLPYEEFFDLAYDTLARANWVNERIMQGTFDKAKWLDPPKYFLDKYGYDYLAVAEQISNFKEQIYNFGEAIETRKEEVDKFSPIEKVMFQLNCSVLDDMELIKIKITSSKKSII